MKILAVDTSGKSTSLAILENESILDEIMFNLEIHHSEIVMPALNFLCQTAGINIKEIDLYACTTGPGSFTGLRIGLSTIKGLALATGKPVVGISTLHALTLNAAQSSLPVCPMLDAKKNQVYAAIYRKSSTGVFQNQVPDRLTDLDSLFELIDEKTLFIGDGAIRYRDRIESAFPGSSLFAEPFSNQVRGGVVGFLGYQRFQAGEMDDVLSITPRYLRLSEAEEKRRLMKETSGPDRY